MVSYRRRRAASRRIGYHAADRTRACCADGARQRYRIRTTPRPGRRGIIGIWHAIRTTARSRRESRCWRPVDALVIRELMVGASGFNEIHRGIPRISRTLLAQRLRLLERRGLVRRGAGAPGRPGRYSLTPAGESVTPIVGPSGTGRRVDLRGPPLRRTATACPSCGACTSTRTRRSSPAAHRRAPDTDRRGCRRGLARHPARRGHRVQGRPWLRRRPGDHADTGQMQRWLVGLVPFRDLIADGHARLLGPAGWPGRSRPGSTPPTSPKACTGPTTPQPTGNTRPRPDRLAPLPHHAKLTTGPAQHRARPRRPLTGKKNKHSLPGTRQLPRPGPRTPRIGRSATARHSHQLNFAPRLVDRRT